MLGGLLVGIAGLLVAAGVTYAAQGADWLPVRVGWLVTAGSFAIGAAALGLVAVGRNAYRSPVGQVLHAAAPTIQAPALAALADVPAVDAPDDQLTSTQVHADNGSRWPWRNLYRPSDPIGGAVFYAYPISKHDTGDVDWQLMDPLIDPPAGDLAWPRAYGHSDYFLDPAFAEALQVLDSWPSEHPGNPPSQAGP